MKTWVKRAVFSTLVLIISAIYVSAKPTGPATGLRNEDQNESKEILGEQSPPAGGPATLESYIVKKDDTLFNVSQKYGLSWQTLAEINNLEEPFLLRIGQTLNIPTR